MPIPTVFLERIKAAPISGVQIADAFTKLAKAADTTGTDDCAINIEYAGDGDTLLPGDLVPMITLSLTRQQTTQGQVDPEKASDLPFAPAEAALDMDDEDPYPEE